MFAGPESAYPVVEKPRPDPVTSGVVKSGEFIQQEPCFPYGITCA